MSDVALRLAALAIIVSLAAIAPASAEPPAGQIGVVDGALGTRLPGRDRWTPARPEDAVAAGQSLHTDPRSRAELRLADGTLDIAPNTRLDIIGAAGKVAEFGLPQGRLRLRLARLDPGRTVAVDLPQGAVWIEASGEYDIDAGTLPQPGRIAVLSGLARFTGPDADTDIKSEEAVVVTGMNPVIIRFERAVPDGFVAWGRGREAGPPLAGSTGPAPPATAPGPAPPPETASAEEAPRHLEQQQPHRHYERHVVRRYHGHHAYAAARPFNPLQPLFSLFRW